MYSMKKIFKTFAFAFTCFILMTAVFAQNPDDANAGKNTSAPKVTKVDETTIKAVLKPNGKPLLVNFWATWCVPCREEFPELVKLDAEYRGKIDFITISLDDLAEINRDVPKFLSEMKATMPTYLLRTADENAVIGSITKDWSGGLPFTVLYDENGNLEYFKQGIIKVDIVKEKINSLLATDAKTSESSKTNKSYDNGMKDAKEDISNDIFIIKTFGDPLFTEYYKKALK